MLKPKLQRMDWYLKDVHNMVRNCRARKDVYIPPTWLTSEETQQVATMLNVPAVSGGAKS